MVSLYGNCVKYKGVFKVYWINHNVIYFVQSKLSTRTMHLKDQLYIGTMVSVDRQTLYRY